MKRLVALCFVLAVAAGSSPARAQNLDEVLARHYEAMGGLENTKAVAAVQLNGTATVPMQGLQLSMTIYQQRPNRVRVEQTIEGTKLVQAFDGETAWMINPFMGAGEPTEVPGSDAAMLAEMGDFDGPLYDYAAKGHTLTLAGEEDLAGRPAYRIDATLAAGEQQTLYLDAETYMVLRKVMSAEQQGRKMSVAQIFSDYRTEGGIQVPHAIETTIDGQTMSKMTIDSVTINPQLDAELFSMPGKE